MALLGKGWPVEGSLMAFGKIPCRCPGVGTIVVSEAFPELAFLCRELSQPPKERSVAKNGTTDIRSVLVLDILAPLRVEEPAGVEIGVAEIFIDASVQFVRATAGRDIDRRPGVAPVLGAVKAGQNLQLAQEFDARRAIPVRSVVQLVHRRQA